MVSLLKKIRVIVRNNYYARKHFKKLKLDNNKTNLLIFSTPIHRNIGDHAIIDAEYKYFSSEFPDLNFVEIPRQFVSYFLKNFKVKKEDIILIHGGGFFGTLYPDEMHVINKIITLFNKNKIIIMPQTIYYDETDAKFSNEFREVMSKHPNLTLFVREKASYDIAINLDIFKKVLLVPDIVMSQHPSDLKINKIKNILLVLRNDSESILGESISDLSSILSQKGYNVMVTDTVAKHNKFILPKDRTQTLNDKLQEFTDNDLIITDRLHGMIFSYMSGRPCIALDNLTKKSSGVFDLWFPKYKGITLLTDDITTDKIVNSLDFNFDSENFSSGELISKFEILKEEITNSISI